MSRSALPQNYTINPGTLWQDFEGDLSDWAIDVTGIKTIDTVNFHTGAQSMKLTVVPAQAYASVVKTFGTPVDLRQAGKLVHWWFYCHDDPGVTVSSFQFWLTSAGPYYVSNQFGPSTIIKPGWNHCVMRRATGDSNFNWAAVTKLTIKIYAVSGQTPSVSLDSIYIGVEQLPRCLITFDDGYSTVYTEGFSYMNSKGLRGTLYIIPGVIGQASYMTLAQLDEMYAAGWAVANHTYHHSGNLPGHTQVYIENELTTCTDWLLDHGYTRAAYHVAYPGGAYDDTVLAAMSSSGGVTGRTVISTVDAVPVVDLRLLRSNMLTSSQSLAQIKLSVDDVVLKQGVLILHTHNLLATATANSWDITSFRALIDYLIARKVRCVTIDEWYKGLTNPRYRSLPLIKA